MDNYQTEILEHKISHLENMQSEYKEKREKYELELAFLEGQILILQREIKNHTK